MGRQREEGVACPTASRNWEVPCAAKGGQRGLKVSAGAGAPPTPGAPMRHEGPRVPEASLLLPWPGPYTHAPTRVCIPLLPTLAPGPCPCLGQMQSPCAQMCRNVRLEPPGEAWSPSGLAPAFRPGPDPAGLGSSPASGSLHQGCFSLCLCVCLSRSLSLCVS